MLDPGHAGDDLEAPVVFRRDACMDRTCFQSRGLYSDGFKSSADTVTCMLAALIEKRRTGSLVQLFSWEKVTSLMERIGSLAILAAVLLFVVVVTFVLLLLGGSRMRGGEKPRVCASRDCIHHARTLGIDVGRSPSLCESFGRFVCSGWKTGDLDFANTVSRQAALEWILRVEKRSLGDFDRDAVVNRPLIMMRECMRHADEENDAVASFIAIVNSTSFAWPTQDEEPETPVADYARALRLLLELSVLWALPLWFHVRMLPAAAHIHRDRAIVLSLSRLASTWQVFHKTLLRYDDAYPIYLSYFNTRIFKYRPPSQSFVIFLKTRSASVQTQVLSNLSSVSQALHRKSRLLEIRTLPAIVRKLAAEDWVQAFQSLYSPSHNVTANDLLLATNGGLLKAVGAIFARNTAQDIIFHTIWWFVQSVGAVASSDLFSAVNKHSDSMHLRQIICFDHAHATYNVLLASVHKALFSTHERLSIARHLESVRTVAIEKLRSYSKLSESSKITLSSVLEDMSTVIWPEEDFGRPGGFAEYYGQPYRGRDGFLGEWLWSRLQLQNNSAAVAAGSRDYVAASKIYQAGSDQMISYNPILNTMSVSLTAVSAPFYYPEATSAMIYGGVGFLYAQAIFEALDDLEHLLHGGVTMQPSDAMTTAWAFWNASWCQHIDNRLAFPEVPALDVAYTAYIRFRDEAADLPLKGLPCCTPKQVFFVTMCHCSCYVGSSKTTQSRVCDVAVKNFEPFSETFSCPFGSSMNTYPKCVYA
ncbi:membrane metallo-endopeptidase-like 1 [Dermacentor andersoni]|uniref:membrane metallo-endopeptidase-like 1 n=1 Tax=Dermacentor andersoni TaxID=34620 RepID=UPI003B3BBF82